ncbi:MAG: DNA polymerase III subunit delta [Coriobacteriia bacterium]|nr:DNA polymerase III subunit delta [Coriobacteriia bacterium]
MKNAKTDLLSAYLIIGSDELKAQTVIQRLLARLKEQGDLDFNSQILDASKEIDICNLIDSLNTPPLAAPYRVVVVKEIDKAAKALVDEIIDYLASPLTSTVLVMTALKLTQQSRLYKAVSALGSKSIIDACDRKKPELPAMIRKLAQTYEIDLSYEGAVKIAELTGSSSVALNNEVKKLASYVLALGRSTANADDVTIVVARTNQPSSWDFVDAFSRRDIIGSLDVLKLLPRETPVNLLYLCVVRLRELLSYKSLMQRGERNLPKAMGKPEWQVRRLSELASKYELVELSSLLAQAAEADARMKSGEDAKLVLEGIILKNCHN